MTDPDGKGIAGLELGLNDRLANALPGASVALSLDMRVQYALAHEVEQAREKFTARAAGGIVMDVRTGEILAMASLPEATVASEPLPNGVDPRRNRMAQDVYELGSVFKIFSFALAMEDHTTRMDEVFPIGNGFKIGKFTIHEAEHMPADAGSARYPRAILECRHGPDRACGRVRIASGRSWEAWVCSMPRTRNCRKARAAHSPPLGPSRNRDDRLRSRHFGQPARFRRRGCHHR